MLSFIHILTLQMVEQQADYILQELTSGTTEEDSDLHLIFQDGQLKIDKLLFCAVSKWRCHLDKCDCIIVESTLNAGNQLLNLILTGRTENISHSLLQELKTLTSILLIEIDLVTDKIIQEEKEVYHVAELQKVAVIVRDRVVRKPKESRPEKVVTEHRRLFHCDIPPCNDDSGQYVGLRSFRKHTTQTHGVKPLTCPESGCHFRADDVSKLDNHVYGVHRSLDITCEICDKIFPNISYLKSHKRRMHQVDRSQRRKVCPYCGESKLQLNDHIMRAHKVKKYFCDLCPKSFKTNVQLRQHRNTHTGFKPYTCNTCDARFSRLHHRKVHLDKLGHSPGPVLKPPDHVDQRTVANRTQVTDQPQQEQTFYTQLSSEVLKNEMGIDCGEIIENITIGSVVDDVVDLEFE